MSVIHDLIQHMARHYKGPSYSIDKRIPIRSLFGFSLRRLAALMRCVLRGIVVSLNPKKLVFIGPSVELRNRAMINFGGGITLQKGVIIDGLSERGISIGDDVSIGPFSIIEATGVITNIGIGCTIGAHSGIGAFSYIGAAGGVWIGQNVIMGQRVSFHSENHRFDRMDIPIRLQGITRAGITIEDDCWIGANVTFLDGSHVGKGSVIAAGAVVRDRIPPYSVAAGVPAKVITQRKPA